ncbi:MAG TPA: hypothetical protein VFE13_04975 [Caulobacteraceae bacterium]|jgi:hypothetical protein|nr:hypothetical protein [Caulobacteraceae bacterium]
MPAASPIFRPAGGHAARPEAALDARLRLMIANGGDERIWLDPVTRRNRYGVPATPAPDELWFSSSTASAVSERGWRAAGQALEHLTEPGQHTIAGWFDGLRRRLLALYGAPGAQAILTASGTEAELVTLSLALGLAHGPVTNIVVAPAETGSGVPAAASGLHFLGCASLGVQVTRAQRLSGWDRTELRLEAIEIRTGCGALRSQRSVDHEAASKVAAAVAGGAFAVLHVLDASKTGRSGVSRGAAAEILGRHPERVLVVVDACQLRCTAADISADLEAGFAVMMTGSKFAGGPAFCGAVLLPPGLVEPLMHAAPAGPALAPYSAAFDWPDALRDPFTRGLNHLANLGLGLRWTAALAEIEAYEAVPPGWRAALLDEFGRAVRARVAADRELALVDHRAPTGAPGLIPVAHRSGADPRPTYEKLARGESGGRPCHLGQPVAVGARQALRVCASMPMIVDAAEHGFASLEAGLDELFESWARLRG